MQNRILEQDIEREQRVLDQREIENHEDLQNACEREQQELQDQKYKCSPTVAPTSQQYDRDAVLDEMMRREVQDGKDMGYWDSTTPAGSSDAWCRNIMRMGRRGRDFAANLQQTTSPISPTTSSTLKEADRIETLLDEAEKMAASKENKNAETKQTDSPAHESPPATECKTAGGAVPGPRRKAMGPFEGRGDKTDKAKDDRMTDKNDQEEDAKRDDGQ